METFTTEKQIDYIEEGMMILVLLRCYRLMDYVDGQREVLSWFTLVVAHYYADLGDAKEANRLLSVEAFIRNRFSDDDICRLTEQVIDHAEECGL